MSEAAVRVTAKVLAVYDKCGPECIDNYGDPRFPYDLGDVTIEQLVVVGRYINCLVFLRAEDKYAFSLRVQNREQMAELEHRIDGAVVDILARRYL